MNRGEKKMNMKKMDYVVICLIFAGIIYEIFTSEYINIIDIILGGMMIILIHTINEINDIKKKMRAPKGGN